MPAATQLAIDEVREVLQRFQDGYTRRDLTAVDEFMELFAALPELEVIGTNGIRPGVDEWHLGRAGARELVAGDWEGWGDVRLDVEGANIHVLGEVAWLATPATVTMDIPKEANIRSYLGRVQEMIAKAERPPEELLHDILRGGSNTLYEQSRGEHFVWPLRFTAVLVRDEGEWKFHQMNFSFPTTRFPDERIVT